MSRLCAPWNELPRWRELDVLTEAYSENTLDAEQAARLETLLLEDREAKRRFLGYLYLDGAMRWDGAVGVAEWLPSELAEHESHETGVGTSPTNRSTSVRQDAEKIDGLPWVSALGSTWRAVEDYYSRSGLFSVLVSALVMVTLLTLLAFGTAPSFRRWMIDGPATATEVQYVARVTGAVDAQWNHRDVSGSLGDGVVQDVPLELTEGLIQLEFSQGATLVIQGPATFVAKGQNAALLHRGTLMANVPKQAIGFTLATPHSQVVDLGTEFGVRTEPRSGTEISVLDGMVEVQWHDRTGETKGTRLLQAGTAVRIAADSTTLVEIDFVAQKFRRLATTMQPRRELMVYEGFDYGTAKSLHGRRGGIGFGRYPWNAPGVGLAATPEVALLYPSGCKLRATPQRLFDTGNGHAERKLPPESRLYFDADETYFVSFLLRRSPENPGPLSAALQLWDSQKLRVAFALTCHNLLRLNADMVLKHSPHDFVPGTTYFIVGKIDANPASTEDRLYMKVYAVDGEAPMRLETHEPEQWTVAATMDCNATINHLQVWGGEAPRTWEFDELRIGRTWESVTAGDHFEKHTAAETKREKQTTPESSASIRN